VRLKSTYALASQLSVAGAALLEKCMLWESARPYLYARGGPQGRVMIGGEDIDSIDPSIRDALLTEKAHSLISKFNLLFPAATIQPDLAWAGTFAETADGMPFIGSTPRFPLGIFCLGYGGNGITFSLVAAEMVRDALRGLPVPHQHLFRLDR
jgi:glycine/D-amino acid oxidase-like deaminating enzyme